MRKRIFKMGIKVGIAISVLVVSLAAVSLLVIDRAQPTVSGTLSSQELTDIRRAVRRNAVETPLRLLSVGEISASWHYLKELYTYRILSVEVLDADTAFVFTRTNSYYVTGMRRPDFIASRIDGVWQAGPPTPMF